MNPEQFLILVTYLFTAKKLPEFVLPLEQRISDVRQFLMDIDNTLNYEVVAIQDPCGPAATDPNLDVSFFFKYL
jgi:phosphopantetheine adenylyltransferase